MAENKYSTEGMLEDLIRAMVQLCATELHEKTNLERLNADLELGRIQLTDFTVKEMELMESLDMITEARRNHQKLIYTLAGEKGDMKEWCKVKHMAMAMYTTFEAYQASENDQALYSAYLQVNKLFIATMTKFLGFPVTDCASCFTDFLKGGGEEDGL